MGVDDRVLHHRVLHYERFVISGVRDDHAQVDVRHAPAVDLGPQPERISRVGDAERARNPAFQPRARADVSGTAGADEIGCVHVGPIGGLGDEERDVHSLG